MPEMAMRGIRGATTADANSGPAIITATQKLLREIVAANDVHPDDIASVFFTTTPDLVAEFPAAALRKATEAVGLECNACTVLVDGLSLISDDPDVRRKTLLHLKDLLAMLHPRPHAGQHAVAAGKRQAHLSGRCRAAASRLIWRREPRNSRHDILTTNTAS